jgi:protein-S-isoprenylcysteine O-methyltransferase Ste14
MDAMSLVPSLGPRGEGWVVLQVVMLVLVAAGGAIAPGTAGLLSSTAGIGVGLVLLILGGSIALVGVGSLQTGRSVSALPYPRGEISLVTTGAYSYIRHPIYTGLILSALGWVVLQDSGPALIATLGLSVVLDLKRRREEAWLDQRFGEYAAYRERTKAFIPFVY